MDDLHLCQIVEGVEKLLRVHAQHFRLVVVAEALVDRFAADSTPESWLRAYRSNAGEIERIAFERFRRTSHPIVIIQRFDE